MPVLHKRSPIMPFVLFAMLTVHGHCHKWVTKQFDKQFSLKIGALWHDGLGVGDGRLQPTVCELCYQFKSFALHVSLTPCLENSLLQEAAIDDVVRNINYKPLLPLAVIPMPRQDQSINMCQMPSMVVLSEGKLLLLSLQACNCSSKPYQH